MLKDQFTVDEPIETESTLKKHASDSPKRTFLWRSLFRFNLRTMLILVLLVSAWLAWHLDRAKKQERAANGVIDTGGSIKYDFQFDGEPAFGKQSNFIEDAESPYPKFLLDVLGYNFFHSVVSIDLANNENGGMQNKELKTEWAEQLGSLKNLQFAYMRWSQVDDKVLKRLGKLKHLRVVHVWRADSITDEGIRDLVNCRNLEQAHFYFSGLTDESLKHLSTLPEIEVIHLQGNSLSDAGLKFLRDKTKLTELSLGMSQEEHYQPRTERTLPFKES